MNTSKTKNFWRRYGLTLISFWSLIIFIMAAITLHNHNRDLILTAENEARDYYRLNLFYRAFVAKVGGVYAPVDKVSPNPHLRLSNRDITTTDGQRLTLLNPAYLTRLVFESIMKSSPEPVISKLTSLKPLNPQNMPDEWERKALEGFDRGEYKDLSEILDIDGKPYLRLISVFITEEACLKCHAHQGYKKGDIRGGISIAVPMSSRIKLGDRSRKDIAAGHMLLWFLGSVGIAISSRRRFSSEEKLLASERKFRTLSDWTQDWEYWLSPDGKMHYVSPSCIEITGYTKEEFTDDPELVKKIVHPDDRNTFNQFLFSNDAAPENHNEMLDFRIITRGGETRWIQILSRPIFDGTDFLGIRTSNRDVTKNKLADEKLGRLSSIVESSDDAIISTSLSGTVTSWNRGAENLFGYTEEEMLDRPLMTLLPADHAAEERDILETVASGKTYKHLDTFKISKDGKRIDLSVIISPVTDSNDNNIGISLIARDITNLKRAEQERLLLERQIMQTQKLESLGVLAGGIAHDFNNILMAIIGNVDLALLRLNKESSGVENMRRVREAATRAADLAQQMLAYSGKGKFMIENIDMNLLIEEMLHLLEVSISKKVVLRLNLDSPLPAIAADATQMRQIIMNLVINASEAIGEKSGIISIRTGQMDCTHQYLKQDWLDDNISEGLYVYLEIADTGCGMSSETAAKIFDPFFSTKFTGRGLGMAAVLGIIRGHNGSIKVYSELGKGTSFKILLPASNMPAESSDSKPHSLKNWQGSGTVLIVDDEEAVLKVSGEMLRELGFEVITALDGREGIDLYTANMDKIVCVILDLTMPGLDGEQAFRKLRQIKPDIKVLMSSGYNEQEVTERFIGKGLSGFIQKPYKLSTLSETLRSTLEENSSLS